MDLTPILSLSQQTCLLLNADSLTSVLNRWKYTSHLMCVAVYLFCTLFISNLNCRMLRRAASFPSSYIPSRFSLSNISHFLLGQNAYHNFKIQSNGSLLTLPNQRNVLPLNQTADVKKYVRSTLQLLNNWLHPQYISNEAMHKLNISRDRKFIQFSVSIAIKNRLVFTTCRNLLNMRSITEHTKGNWYLVARKKTDRQTVHGSEC